MSQSYTKKNMGELESAAEGGDRQAQNSLAMLHELGLIPNAKLSEASKWYGREVKAGNPQAAIALARLQEQEVPKVDEKLTGALYAMAKKHGYRSPQERRDEVFAKKTKATIMVVDDSEHFRKLASGFFENKGYKVFAAADAFQAMRYIENGNQVDIVLSDIEMPNMDGVEMLQLIRNRYQKKDLPVIMVTSSRDVELMKRAKSYGLQGWVLKPYEPEALLQTMLKVMKVSTAS